jgi:hypothetical protein
MAAITVPEFYPCRACRHWKRKTYDAGVCWNEHQPWYGAMVQDSDTCDQHQPKVILVVREHTA